MSSLPAPRPHETAIELADTLNAALNAHQLSTFAPDAKKKLRLFPAGEVASILGVSPQYLRTLHAESKIEPAAEMRGGKRYYTAEHMLDIRKVCEAQAKKKKGEYLRGRRQGDALQIFEVMNFKGGACKTSTVLFLSHKLALDGFRVLVVDLDPQASLTTLFGYRPEIDLIDVPTAYDAVRYDDPLSMQDVVQRTYFPNIDIVCGELRLQSFEHETAAVLGDKSRREIPFYQRIALALGDVEQDYDIVLIDSPPQLGFLTIAGAVASTSILVPVVPSMLDIASTAQFLRMTGELLEVMNDQGVDMRYDHFKFLITRHEPGDGPQQQMVGFLRHLFGDRVMTSTVLKSTAISDATIWKQSIYEVDRTTMNRGTYDRARESLDAVAAEFESLVEAAWGR